MNRSLIPSTTRFPMFDDFRKEVDQLMEQFFSSGTTSEGELSYWTPRINLAETEKQYEVTVELPGVKPEELDVELRHGDLWITGERRSETEDKGKTWLRVERSYSQFRRAVRLGDDVDAENVDAEYKDGVLRITVPKTEASQSRRIEIKS